MLVSLGSRYFLTSSSRSWSILSPAGVNSGSAAAILRGSLELFSQLWIRHFCLNNELSQRYLLGELSPEYSSFPRSFDIKRKASGPNRTKLGQRNALFRPESLEKLSSPKTWSANSTRLSNKPEYSNLGSLRSRSAI